MTSDSPEIPEPMPLLASLAEALLAFDIPLFRQKNAGAVWRGHRASQTRLGDAWLLARGRTAHRGTGAVVVNCCRWWEQTVGGSEGRPASRFPGLA